MIEIPGIVSFGRVRPYDRQGLYGLSEVFPFIGEETHEFDGDPIRMTSIRYRVFRRSHFCVSCSLEGLYFAKERSWFHRNYPDAASRRFHFNLYGLRADGREILFTRDHTIPKSANGQDTLANLTTMCSPCNNKKKDRKPGETDVEYGVRVAARELANSRCKRI